MQAPWVWASAVLWLLAACSDPADNERVDPVIGGEGAAVGAQTDSQEATSDTFASADYPASGELAEPEPSSAIGGRSAVPVPFGEADLWLGARNEPGDVVVWTQPQDTPGALWEPYGWLADREDVSARILDMCVFEEAYASVGRGLLEPGEPVLSEYLAIIQQRQWGLDCYGQPKHEDPGGRWFYLTPEGSSPYFATREGAKQWRQEQRDKYRNTLPGYAKPLGFHSVGNSTRFSIEYSDVEDPIDEVRVLVETVAVRDGVLRGMVRNWSRTMWAYSVTVTAEGKSWQWPLSVQPGETAPFEIENWDGPDDTARIMFQIEASMSPKADLSRSYRWGGTIHPLTAELAESFRQGGLQEPEVVDEIIDLISATRWSYTVGSPIVPASHPSFADHIENSQLGFDPSELRGYVAYFRCHPRPDCDWTVFEVIDQPIIVFLGHLYADIFDSNFVNSALWSGLPDPHLR